jgi:hypothetical protein
MALILILACAAIVILEIYLAREARELERKVADQGRLLAEQDGRIGRLAVVDADLQRLTALGTEHEHSVREQDDRLDELIRKVNTHLTDLRSEVTGLKTELRRLDDRTGHTEQGLTEIRTDLGGLARELDVRSRPWNLESLKAEVTRLGRDCSDLAARLTAADAQTQVLARTLADQEAEAEGVRQRLLRSLDQQADAALGEIANPVIVRGAVYGAVPEPGLEDSLVRRYDECAGQYGLTTELRSPWRGSGMYFLSCTDPRLVEAAFLEQVRRLRDGQRSEDSLHSLLTGLQELPQGLVQLGPFVAARTPQAFRCAVLTPQESRRFRAEAGPGGPASALDTLAGSTERRGCDLAATWPDA